LLDKQKEGFVKKVFTFSESQYCFSTPNPAMHFAGRFAAKESIKKCLFSSKIISSIGFSEIEILSKKSGAPYVSLIGDLKIKDIQLSISHETDFAVAVAIMIL
jgi:holo-[acyl-carrier protein] synthase